jgi:hypothetical protein
MRAAIVSVLAFVSAGLAGAWFGAAPLVGGAGFEIVSATRHVELSPGGFAAIDVQISRSGGGAGAVTVGLDLLPAGVEGGHLTIPGGQSTGTVLVAASSRAPLSPPGDRHRVDVIATGSGARRAVAIEMTVTAGREEDDEEEDGKTALARSGSAQDRRGEETADRR